MIAPDNKAPFLLRNHSALFRNISKTHHASPLKSVPLRGLWFLSTRLSCMNCKSIITSFRPLTGIMVLIIIQPRLEFPSPYGDYGSYQYRVLDEYIDSWYGFPSPCGDYGSYHIPYDLQRVYVAEEFPSPCGDYGSYRAAILCRPARKSRVSVPLRGLWFLSH